MSDPSLNLLVDDLPLHLPPETLKRRLADLVRRYALARSAQLAHAVVRHSEALALHPALRDESAQRHAFCRLNRHWRLLAAQCALAATP